MSNNAKYSHNNEGSQVATAPVQPVVVHPATSISIEEITAKTPKSLHIESGLERTIEKLELRERADEAIDSQATPAPDLPKASSSSEDEQSHVSGSSSKLQSFDTKSIASITTFQMDEKESLRPDDSASVQAIDEDESIVNSRVGSELGPVGPRDVSRDLLLKRAPVVLPGNGLRFGELSPATPNSMAQNPALRQMSFISGERLHTAESQATPAIPDEKLLEAMATPKDRLLLLQMEEKVLIFIHDNKDEYLDLPPQNSFGRMLAHKLADYYNLNHFVGNDASTVRLFRTPASRLPPLLSSFASAISQNASNPAMAGVKIMRRGGASSRKASVNPETPTSSSAPSKATSEAGGDTNSEEGLASPAEPNTNKEKAKLTREEREAQYEAARRRIFADIPESTDMPNGGESSASMSRSSSASGKKRGHKQRQPKDDSFEARSQFNMYYPGMHFANNNAYTGRQPNIGYGQAPFVSQGQSNTAGSGFASPAVPFQPYGQQPYAQMQQFPIDQSHYGQQMGWSGMQNDATSPFYSFDASSPMSNTQPSDVQSPAMNH
ncbi:putative r3h domain [Phaeomoniella chlamydospora]|uniref:Putative r3h domain n=1 Tax=Phaeomoniella chlamydospora TaxID=158046 RepID=A0A0G2ENS4_PHACM|nr:putative r3h domain [Phaeomoniella chlamydospora]